MLPRGRGILADDIEFRVGPLLREICGVSESDDSGILRRKVRERLNALSNRLPDDLGHAVRLALALGGSSDRFLKDRVDHLATTIRRDPRTAKRRVDEGLRRLAEVIAEEPTQPPVPSSPFVPDGWYVQYAHAVLLLDRDPPQLIERRQIVATEADLDSVVVMLSTPDTAARPAPASIDVLHGGLLVRESRLGAGNACGTIRLPDTLSTGTGHEYSVLCTMPIGATAINSYLLTSYRRCDLFELSVRFGRTTPTPVVRAVEALPAHILGGIDLESAGGSLGCPRLLPVDSVGEVHISFTALRPGMSYGVRWCAGSARAVQLTPLVSYG
jgi:hypothetical protein